MTFISVTFFLFLFITFLIYYIFPIKFRWIVLLLASIGFYLSWGKIEILFILISSLIVYLCALRMGMIYENQELKFKEDGVNSEYKKIRKLKDRQRCKKWLLLGAISLLLVLIYTKSGARIFEALGNWMNDGRLSLIRVIVPLGISYYTFSLIGYLADVYWRKEKAEKNYFRLLLFAMYFPKILMGPISRHKALGSQLNEGHRFHYEKVCFGLQLALWGFFKKLVIADRLSIFVNSVFGNIYGEQGSLIFVVAAMFASFQLYCDFSGCMDIAEGVSEMFGIEMEKNFNHPFFSCTAAEFWRRWHITLGTWFKDYIYMPLAISPRMMKMAQWFKKKMGARASKNFMLIVPTAIVWILTGLWHGTGYNYIAWGIYWGMLIILSSVFAPEIKKLTEVLHINTKAPSWKVVQQIRTFLIFTIARIIVLPGHLTTSWDVVKKIFSQFDIWILTDGTLFQYGLNAKNFIVALIAIGILWFVSLQQEKGSLREHIAQDNLVIRWALYYGAFFAVLIFGIYGSGFDSSVFTYMNY